MNTQDRINELETTVKSALKEIEALKEQYEREQAGEWVPRFGEIYSYVSDRLEVCTAKYDTVGIDDIFFKAFNSFQTKEQAQRRADMLYVQNELFHLAEKYNKGIEFGHWRYSIRYDKEDERMGVSNCGIIEAQSVFVNDLAARNAIAALSDRSKEWFKNQI